MRLALTDPGMYPRDIECKDYASAVYELLHGNHYKHFTAATIYDDNGNSLLGATREPGDRFWLIRAKIVPQ